MERIEFFRHSVNDADIERARSVLESIFLTTGKEVEELEEKFSDYLKCRNTVGVTSCTAALHLSLIAHGIGERDEIITTPMSFCATSNAILHAGAKPVFVDVEPETGNMSAELIESAITDRTKAILPVHLYGQMCDMRRIKEIADKYDLKVIEDAAHSIEASRDNIRVGELSDAACFSFYATKNITSGEGGAITTNDDELTGKFKMLRSHGIDKHAADRYSGQYEHWDMQILGWKYNMDNIQAALLIGQLERIDDLWNKRDELWKLYEQELTALKEVRCIQTVRGAKHARQLFAVLVPPDKRDEILWKLQDRGIGVAVNYRPIHLLKYYRETFDYRVGDFPIAEDIGSRTISLPLYPSLGEEDVVHIVNTLKEILGGVR